MLTQGRKAVPRFCFLGFLAVVIAFRCFLINGEEKQVERSHIGVQIRGKEQENRSPSPSQSHNIRVRHTGRQQVVLLAGPHKTASSSIQRNLFHWLNDDGHASGLSKDWAWPSPSQTFREDGCSVEGDFEEQQIFYWLIQALKGGSSKQIRCINSSVYTKLGMIEKYRNEIYNQWMKGYNLVIASEAMDFVSSERNRNPRRLLKRILDLLPWRGDHDHDHDHDHSESGSGHVPGSDDDITVVVNYRAPRSSHLISIWHECCMANMTFYEFLTDGRLDSGTSLDPLKSLDSLKLAKTFLDRGLEVILVDMSGVQAHNFDISRVIACDVLGASCTPDKMFAVAGPDPQMKEYGSQMATETGTGTGTGTVSTNQKQHTEDNFNISHEVLGEVDAIIENYDCNFIDLMKNGNFTVLHEYKLKQIFQKCESETYNRNDRVTSREDMVQRIVNIAKEIKSKE